MNICTYTPDPNILTQAKVNREFALLHKYLCYLASQAGGSGTPGGADTNIQFNNSGAFGGSGNLTWNNSTQQFQITGTGSVTSNASGFMGITIGNQDAGAGSSGSITFNSDAIPNTSAIFQNSSNNTNFGGAFSLNIGTFVGGAVTILTNDAVALTVNPSGNVMIGTQTTNGSKLQVSGAISTTDTVTSSIGGSAATPVFSIGGDRGMWSNSSDVLNFTAGHGNSTLTLSDNNGFGCARIGGAPTFPSAILDIQTVSDGSVGTAPIKIPIGTLLATPEDGAFEYDGTHFYFTIGVTRHTIV